MARKKKYDEGFDAGYDEGYAEGVDYAQETLGVVIWMLKWQLDRFINVEVSKMERERDELTQRIENMTTASGKKKI